MDHKEIINRFYNSFAASDAEGMIDCYHDEIRFEDPAFGPLNGEDAKNMWRMLVRPGIIVTHSNVIADEHTGSADWTAVYTFGNTGKKVINNISASFEFRDGKIIRHTDKFSMRKWARQALGFKGFLLGGTTFLQQQVRKQALAKLTAFTAEKK